MRILNVTAQKPNSTGSGIFLSELMKEFANKGHTQALVAGVYPEEETPVPDRVTFYPVYFEQGKLSFPIVGMSDEMPYPSTRYRDMTPKMEAAFKESFLKQLDEAVPATLPDFERRIGQRIWESVEAGKTKEVDVSGLSWTKIAGEVLKVLSLTS